MHLARRGVVVNGIDAAPQMVAGAAAKLRAEGMSERARFRVATVEDLAELPGPDPQDRTMGDTPDSTPANTWDGAYANFGVLNCVTDLPAFGQSLAARIRPGGRFLAVVMGPNCAWEWAWYLGRGDRQRAFRRRRRGGIDLNWDGHKLHVDYPSIGQLKDALSPHFELQASEAIGFLLPPSYAADWLNARPRLLARCVEIESEVARWPLAVRLADHYLADFTRVDAVTTTASAESASRP